MFKDPKGIDKVIQKFSRNLSFFNLFLNNGYIYFKYIPTRIPKTLFTLPKIKFIKKETLAQVFSCEFCEITKNTFFTEHLWTTASNYFYKKFHHRYLTGF